MIRINIRRLSTGKPSIKTNIFLWFQMLYTPTGLTKTASPEREREREREKFLREQDDELHIKDSMESGCSSLFGFSSIGEQKHQNEGSDDEFELTSLLVDADLKRGSVKKQHWKSQSLGETDELAQINSLHGNIISSQDENFEEYTTFSANRELWQRRATSQTQLNPPVTPKSIRASQELREMRQKHTPDLVMDLPLSAQDSGKKSSSSNSLSSSDEETPMQSSRAEAVTSPSGGLESPDMSTAAERFAKQNQCTLKKNTKTSSEDTKFKRMENAEAEAEVDANEISRSNSANQISEITHLRSPLPQRTTPKIAAKFADMHLTGGSQVHVGFKPQVKVKPTILRKPVLPFPHPHISPELSRKIEKQAQIADQTN